MDVSEDKYRKVISEFRGCFSNILNEYPITSRNERGGKWRNLDYMVGRAVLGGNYPYYNPLYEETLEEIKSGISENNNPEAKALALRLARALPLLHRIQLIERCENVELGSARKLPGLFWPAARARSQGDTPTGTKLRLTGQTCCCRCWS